MFFIVVVVLLFFFILNKIRNIMTCLCASTGVDDVMERVVTGTKLLNRVRE